MRVIVLVLGLLLCVKADTARADTGQTIESFYNQCNKMEEAGEEALAMGSVCLGYLLGVADSLTVVGTTWATAKSRQVEGGEMLQGIGICKTSYTAFSLRQLFINWAARHPEKWRDDRFRGAFEAMHEAWPCE